MTKIDITRYKVDHLFLLMGADPLPNYVAAQVLARDPATTRIIMVCSPDTLNEAARRLEKLLKGKSFAHIETIQVEESDPVNIRNQVGNRARGLSGRVGLNYTGGTKAMSVHAYLALKDQPECQFSYLDARELAMKVEGAGIPAGNVKSIPDVGSYLPKDDDMRLTIKQVLDLYGLKQPANKTNKQVKQQALEPPIWLKEAILLLEQYASFEQAKIWDDWCQEKLRHGGDLLPTGKLVDIPIDCIPFASVRQSFLNRYPHLTAASPITDLANAIGFPVSNSKDHLAKWFDGDWLEHYVFNQLQPLLENEKIHDLQISLKPELGNKGEPGASSFEFDIAVLRDYQLFAFSVTRTLDKRLVKHKLLEAVVRAEQLGGSKARVAIVCCMEPDYVAKLEKQLANLLHKRVLLKVFGVNDLPTLGQKVENWINDVISGR